jgi:N-acetylneuraminic acid mutarotase
LAADGYTSGGDTGDNEGYDATTNTWTSYAADPTVRNQACGGGIAKYMYVAGGYQGGVSGSPALSLTESFEPSKDAWKTLAPLPQTEAFGGSAVYKDKLYCLGGWASYEGTALNNVQIYQP